MTVHTSAVYVFEMTDPQEEIDLADGKIRALVDEEYRLAAERKLLAADAGRIVERLAAIDRRAAELALERVDAEAERADALRFRRLMHRGSTRARRSRG